MQPHILVFDVGKTNKKLLLFDAQLNLVDRRTAQFAEYEKDGVHYESVEEIVRWFFRTLQELAVQYPVDAVSITTHGATIVCIGKDGNPVVPVVAYTTEPGTDFHARFYAKMGDPVSLQEQTATPEFGNLLSPAKMVFYLKEQYPREFAQVRYVLNYPQYFGYLLTGKFCAEPTYIGCHSYLWDFHNQQWSVVAARLKLFEKLPPVFMRPWQLLGRVTGECAVKTGLENCPIVAAGIHDSNAALLPYLVKAQDDFVLNSTGTWCVAMRPSPDVRFNTDELGKSVFYILSAYNQPVKTAIFMGGLEFETYMQILKNIHGDLPAPAFNPSLIAEITREKTCFILPSVVQGTGQFPQSAPRVMENGKAYPLAALQAGTACPAFFRDYAKALAVLNLSLAIQTGVTLERVGAGGCKLLFTEGGFRRNEAYNVLLGQLFPASRLYLTDMEEATAFGTALVGRAALEQIDPRQLAGLFELKTQAVKQAVFPGLTDYRRDFLKQL